MNRIVVIGMLLVQLLALSATAQKRGDILGYWLDEKRETVIRIYEDNDMFFGKVVWLKDSLDVFGQPRRDILNDEPEMRSRKVLGADMLIGFKWDEEDTWRKGEIYYYQTGNDYNGKIYLDEQGHLKLKGYYSLLFFLGRTKTWTRVDHLQEYGLK